MNDTLIQILLLVPGLVIAIVFHEVAHGLAARALGDPTAQEQNRLSLNPLRHVDPIGTIILPGFMALVNGPIFGWAKPVPVNYARLDNPRRDMMLVAAAGPGTNLLLGLIGAVILGLSFPASGAEAVGGTGAPFITDEDGRMAFVASAMYYFVLVNCFLAFFNLLPIPPFDGSHILEGLLPPNWARQYAKLRGFGMGLFLALIALNWLLPQYDLLGRLIGPPVDWMLGVYFSIALLFGAA